MSPSRSIIVCALVLLASCLAAPASAGGYKKQYSKYNAATKTYAPVMRDEHFTYFKTYVKLAPTYVDGSTPKTLTVTGDVIDLINNNATVGTYELTTTIVREPGAAGPVGAAIMSGVAEFGPTGDDTMALKGGFEFVNILTDISDDEIAIVGGTNLLLGAFGQVKIISFDGLNIVCETTTIVPRVKTV